MKFCVSLVPLTAFNPHTSLTHNHNQINILYTETKTFKHSSWWSSLCATNRGEIKLMSISYWCLRASFLLLITHQSLALRIFGNINNNQKRDRNWKKSTASDRRNIRFSWQEGSCNKHRKVEKVEQTASKNRMNTGETVDALKCSVSKIPRRLLSEIFSICFKVPSNVKVFMNFYYLRLILFCCWRFLKQQP